MRPLELTTADLANRADVLVPRAPNHDQRIVGWRWPSGQLQRERFVSRGATFRIRWPERTMTYRPDREGD